MLTGTITTTTGIQLDLVSLPNGGCTVTYRGGNIEDSVIVTSTASNGSNCIPIGRPINCDSQRCNKRRRVKNRRS